MKEGRVNRVFSLAAAPINGLPEKTLGSIISSGFIEEAAVDGEADDDGDLNPLEKKRRLSIHQVKFLESSFVVENKPDPERKAQMAKELGLHPRQVAVWFQNRRARLKTKQMEKDYGDLKTSFDALRANHDRLSDEKEKLKAEIRELTKKLDKNQQEEGGGGGFLNARECKMEKNRSESAPNGASGSCVGGFSGSSVGVEEGEEDLIEWYPFLKTEEEAE